MLNNQLVTESDLHPTHPSKKVRVLAKAHWGHIHVGFEDGTMDVIRREDLKGQMPVVGEYWPPVCASPAPAPLPEPEPEPAPLPVTDAVSEPEFDA